MGPRRTGTLDSYTDTTGKTRYRARLRLGDGSRPRFDVPEGYSEARAREWAAAMQEQEDARGGTPRESGAAAMARGTGGEVHEYASGGYAARITIQGRERPLIPLPHCKTRSEAVERTAAMSALAVRLRKAGHSCHASEVLNLAGRARVRREWDSANRAVVALCAGRTKEAADEMAALARAIHGIVTTPNHEPVVELFGEKLRASEAATLLGLSPSEVVQALERGVWRRYFESVLSRIVRLSRENEALKSRVAELEARTGDGVDYLRLEDLLERVGARRFTHLIGVEPTRACELSRLARERRYRADWVQAELDKVASPGKRRVHCDA